MKVGGIRHAMAPLGTRARIEQVVGKPITAYVTLVQTEDGGIEAIFPPDQDPRITADVARGGAHGFYCPDCDA